MTNTYSWPEQVRVPIEREELADMITKAAHAEHIKMAAQANSRK